ncbi:CHAT domain-containing protein [Spirosoma gilvum]
MLPSALSAWAQSAEELQKEGNKIYLERPAEALKLFEQAQQLALQRGQADLAANIRVDEATVYYVKDDYRRATTICRSGFQLSPLTNNTRFKLWASLGEMYHRRDRPDSLGWFWQRAETLLTTHPAIEREARAYVAAFWGNRVATYIEQGDYRQAERCHQKRLLLLGSSNDLVSLVIAENQFALFYRQIGQLTRADSLYRASLLHYTKADLIRGGLLLGLIECRLYQNRIDSVRQLVQEARHCIPKKETDGIELAAYLDQSLGNYWERKKQFNVAKRFVARSLVTGQGLGQANRLVWRGMMAMSRIAQQQNDRSSALTFAQRAIQQASIRFRSTDLSQNPDPIDFLNGPDLFESLCWKAHLLQSSKEVPNYLLLANQTYELAFSLSDLLQESYSTELTKLVVQEKLRPAYREAMGVAFACYRQQPGPATLATLLHRQEQGNASVLREMRRTLQSPYLNAPVQLIDQLQLAKSRLSEAKTSWIERDPASENEARNAELINAELAWNRAYQQLVPYRWNKEVNTDEVEKLQRHLDAKTALLQYSRTTDSVLLTVVKANKVRVLMLPISWEELNQLSTTLRHEAYRNPDPFQYTGRAPARALFNRLIGPIWSELKGINRLVIIRDGPLHYVPFEVLETGRHANDYLLRYAAITYAYSMYSVVDSHLVPPTNKPSVLSMAPFAVTKVTQTVDSQVSYDPLPRSEIEASVLPGTHSTAENASKRTFLTLVPQHQLLHLATHAEANDTDPGNSFIAFFPDESSHRLYAHELDMFDLRHIRLAVLSACRTGSGQLHEGEGLLSLSRAFVSAGCPQVITSLWNAHDGTTATLTRLFYEELRLGKPTDIALQQAKLQFLATQTGGGVYSPPHFWAHLVLMGDHQPVYPEATNWSWGWVVGVVAVFLIGFTYRQYRQKRLY